jgi:flagellar hook-length control protein FliK
MDVAMMQMFAEVPAGQPTKAAGKNPAGKADEGGFAAMFAGLTTAGPGDGNDAAPDTGAMATGETAGMMPATWSFAALLPLMANPAQTTAARTDDTAAGAVTALTAAGTQTARPQPAGAQSPQTATETVAGQGQPSTAAQTAQTFMAPVNGQQPSAAAMFPQPRQATTPVSAQPAMQPTAAAAPGQAQMPTATMTAAPAAPTAVQPPAAAATEATTAARPEAMASIPVQVTEMAPPPVTAATDAPTAANAPADMTDQPQPAALASPNGERPAKTAPAPGSATEQGADATEVSAAPAEITAPTATDGDRPTGEKGATLTAETSAPTADAGAAPAPAAGSQVFATLVDRHVGPTDPTGTTDGRQAQPTTDPYDVAGQIVDHARLISRAETSELVIRLKPEHLGEMTLKIAVENGTVTATFHTANAEVRSAIEATLPQLRQDMANQGLKVDYVGVYASLDQFFANDQRHAPQQQMVRTARRPSGEEVFADAVAAVAAMGSTAAGNGTGIDYRI